MAPRTARYAVSIRTPTATMRPQGASRRMGDAARHRIDQRQVAGAVGRAEREDVGRLEDAGDEDEGPHPGRDLTEGVDEQGGRAEERADDEGAGLDLEPSRLGLDEQVPGAVTHRRAQDEQERGGGHGTSLLCLCGRRNMSDHHDHDDDHAEEGSPLTETELRVRALESLLVEKGLVDPAAL